MSRAVALAAGWVQGRLSGFDPTVARPLPGDGSMPRPVFVVGAPRSGSTLLAQLACLGLRVACLHNIMAVAPRYLLRLARVARWLESRWRPGYAEPRFGYVPGLLGVNEAGPLCRFWFDTPASAGHNEQVDRTFRWLEQVQGLPLLLKNTHNSLRIARIRALLPGARFVHIRRQPLFNAQSILLARRKLLGGSEFWWGVGPPGWERVAATEDPYHQVLWQVLATRQAIAESFADAEDRLLSVDYEALCMAPGDMLTTLAGELGIPLRSQAAVGGLGRVATARDQVRLPASEWRRLERAYGDLESAGLSGPAPGPRA